MNRNMSYIRVIAVCRRIVFLGLLGMLFAGCAKFSPTTSADLTPFAEQTIAMLGETDYGFSQDKTLRIRTYADLDSLNWKKGIETSEKADELLRRIMAYSIDLVTLSESKKTESEKAAALAEYLEQFEDALPDDVHEQFQTLLTDVRSQTTYLDALRAAQPLVNDAVEYGIQLLDENDRLVDAIALDIQANIDAEYAVIGDFLDTLAELEDTVLRSLQLIHRFYLTADPSVLQALGEHLVPLYEILEEEPPSLQDVPEIEDVLIEQLEKVHRILDNLTPDFEAWEEDHLELDRLHAEILDNNRRARLALTVWGRAYQKMASGVENPAEWFELQDILELGGKAIERTLF